MSKGKTAAIVAALVVLVAVIGAGMVFAGQDHLPWISHEGHRSVEPMEVRGRWLGMTVGALDSSIARDWAVPQEAQGVLVLDINRTSGWRALRGGIEPGDVISGIDGTSVYDMSGFYDATRNVDVGTVVLLDVLRGGQVMTLALPAASAIAEAPGGGVPGAQLPAASAPAFGSPEIQQIVGGQPLYQGPPGPGQQGPQGLAYQGPFAAGQRGQGRGGGFGRRAQAGAGGPAAGGPAAGGPFYVCPRHGTRWNRGAVYPSFRCPNCNGPLQQVP